MTGVSNFDAYRDVEARKLMIAFIMGKHAMDQRRAVSELSRLNHVGLAHIYRDAMAAAGRGNQVDYDPLEIGRS
jgi:hypothetical protein